MPMKLKNILTVIFMPQLCWNSIIILYEIALLLYEIANNGESLDVVDIYTFPNSKTIKMTIPSYETTDKFWETGSNCFSKVSVDTKVFPANTFKHVSFYRPASSDIFTVLR